MIPNCLDSTLDLDLSNELDLTRDLDLLQDLGLLGRNFRPESWWERNTGKNTAIWN